MWLTVATPVLLLNWWMVTVGSWSPLQSKPFGAFFDVQARSLMDGRWDVPPEVVRFEGFLVNGETYIYFGPLPALLRMPLFLFTDRFDGRLTMLSMFAAMVVLTFAAYRLSIAVRAFVRGEAPVTRTETLATGVLALAVLTGVPFWMSSTAIVHHEASLWGVALTVAALDALARWVLDPTGSRLAVVGALTALAALSRFTLGLGPLIGLAFIYLLVLVDRWRSRQNGRPAKLSISTPTWAVVLTGLVVAAIAAYPNTVRFGHPINVPVNRHVYTLDNVDRQDFLASANGSFFGPQFAPTTLRQYFRPDAFSLRGEMPWIDYPDSRPKAFGNVMFDGLEWSSSVPVTMPALTVLGAAGLAWFVVAVRRRRPEMWLLPMWLGTVVAAGAVITIGYVGHRYLNDLYPVVLIPALIAFNKLLTWAPLARSPRQLKGRRLLAGGLVGLTVFGTFATVAMTLQYQRERGPVVPEEARADWLRLRSNLPFSKEPVRVERGEALPGDAWESRAAVVGDCDGVYIFVGKEWEPVERGPQVGVYDLLVDIDALDSIDEGQRAPLLTLGSGDQATVVAITRAAPGQVRADVWFGPDRGWETGTAGEASGTVELRIAADRRTPPGVVMHGDDFLYYGQLSRSNHRARSHIGRVPDRITVPGLVGEYPGEIELRPAKTSTCQALLSGWP